MGGVAHPTEDPDGSVVKPKGSAKVPGGSSKDPVVMARFALSAMLSNEQNALEGSRIPRKIRTDPL